MLSWFWTSPHLPGGHFKMPLRCGTLPKEEPPHIITHHAQACNADEGLSGLLQGLGEGPEMLLAGTSDGCIRLMDREGNPVPDNWALGGQPYPDVPVMALAATDNIVVAGYRNGAFQTFPMDTP